MTEFDDIVRDPVSRRAFLARMTAAGLGAAATALLAVGCGGGGNGLPNGNNNGGNNGGNNNGGNNGGNNGPGVFDPAGFPGIIGENKDIVVLNYALTLELTEADIYRQALNMAAGKPVGTPLPDDTSSYTLAVSAGGLNAQNAAIGFLYLRQYAAVEAAHVKFLQTNIPRFGGTPVKRNPNGYKFQPTNNDLKAILNLILVAEETGVTAYLGAASSLSRLDLIQVAATIYSTEARHSAGINYVLGNDIGPQGVFGGKQPVAGFAKNDFEFAQSPAAVLNAVASTFYA